jgi:signal transduction histidine kinase
MNTSAVPQAPPWWARNQHLLLAGHLLLLHALAFGGWQIPAVRILWFVALGLFLLWQPFVAGAQRVSLRQGSILLGLALASTWLLGPWLMLIWCGALAAAIGGRVLWTESRRERAGYLLAFGYLVCLTIFGVVPEISPRVVLDPLPRKAIALYMPLLLPLLLAFPARAPRHHTGEAFDLFYGMLVFLALSVFVLGALAFTLVGSVSYVEALFSTSLTIAAALLVVAWAWNPRRGFSGLGSALSRYLLSVGLPLEQWLVYLAEASESEAHPARFLAKVLGKLEQSPWVVGGQWQAGGESGAFGSNSLHVQKYVRDDLRLMVCFRHKPSPAMRWHVEWLLRLAAEFYLVKFQTHELQRMGYLQAVYETGARVTHDVKNLLQSLQTLCYAAAQPGDPAAVAGLLARQLPLITERLRSTLDKLQRPHIEETKTVSAGTWWRGLQERHAGDGIEWRLDLPSDVQIAPSLFDSVAENLLQNALSKRQREGNIGIALELGVDRGSAVLRLTDTGQAIAAKIAEQLFRYPLQSEFGLGIGLYHAARQAEQSGYALQLVENQPGAVIFRLAPRT